MRYEAKITVMPLSHRFLIHVLVPLNLQGNSLTIMSLPFLKLIVCAHRYATEEKSYQSDVG